MLLQRILLSHSWLRIVKEKIKRIGKMDFFHKLYTTTKIYASLMYLFFDVLYKATPSWFDFKEKKKKE